MTLKRTLYNARRRGGSPVYHARVPAVFRLQNNLGWERIGFYHTHPQYAQLHVIPLNDLRPHDDVPTCWCVPYLDEDVYVHNALDRREEVEFGERMIQ